VGFFIKKMFKIAIIAAIILVVVSYLGFFGLSLAALSDLADKYGPIAIQYGVLLMGARACVGRNPPFVNRDAVLLNSN
jgi:hypothetical protein